MKKVVLMTALFTISILAGIAQTQYYRVDKDNDTIRAKNGKIINWKEGYIIKVRDKIIIWGNDTIDYPNKRGSETKVDPAFKFQEDKILFILNNFDSTLIVHNKLDSINTLLNNAKNIIRCEYHVVAKDSLIQLFYNDNVILKPQQGSPKQESGIIPLFFRLDSLSYEFIIEKGNNDSLTIAKREGNDTIYYLYKNDTLKYCKTDTVLLQCGVVDSTLLYCKSGNDYLIFDKSQIKVESNFFAPLCIWIQNNAWLLSILLVAIVCFVIGILFQKYELCKKIKLCRCKKKEKDDNLPKTKDENKENITQTPLEKLQAIINYVTIWTTQTEGTELSRKANIDKLKTELSELKTNLENFATSQNAVIQELQQRLPAEGEQTPPKKLKSIIADIIQRLENIKTADNQPENQFVVDLNRLLSDLQTAFENDKKINNLYTIVSFDKKKKEIVKRIITDLIQKIKSIITLIKNPDSAKLQQYADDLLNNQLLAECENELPQNLRELILKIKELIEKHHQENADGQTAIKLIEEIVKKLARVKALLDKPLQEIDLEKLETYAQEISKLDNEKVQTISNLIQEIKSIIEKHIEDIERITKENQKKIEIIEDNYKKQIGKKDEIIANEKIEKERKIKEITESKAAEIAKEKAAGIAAVNAEIKKSQHFHDNADFANELKSYAEKALTLLNMGNELHKQCVKLRREYKDNDKAKTLFDNALGKFPNTMQAGKWHEILSYIAYNGGLIAKRPQTKDDGWYAYDTMLQAISEAKGTNEKIKIFKEGLAIHFLNSHCSALLVLIEDMQVLFESKILPINTEIQGFREKLRTHIKNELELKINDVLLLAKYPVRDVDVIGDRKTNITDEQDRIIEIMSYGVGFANVENTKVIISK